MDTPVLTLASASPRRRRLVGWLGLPVEVTAVDTPEDLSAPLPPGELAASLAAEKAVAARAAGARGLILAFDTIVVLGGEVLGKPRDRAEARRMLERLRGGTHEVVTGVAMLPADADAPDTFGVTTPVAMCALTDAEIDGWVARDECLGCAGAYNIEHHLARVEDDQCFNNVAGMPLCHVYAALASGRYGAFPGLTPPASSCDAALGRACLPGSELCIRA